MSKLDEIIEHYNWNCRNGLVPRLNDSEIEWLIEQAKKAEQFEKETNPLGSNLQDLILTSVCLKCGIDLGQCSCGYGIPPIHKYLRDIRVQKGELLKDMANKLGLGSAELSQIEHGKRPVPDDFYEKLKAIYEIE